MQNFSHNGFLTSIILLFLLTFSGCGESNGHFVILSSPEHVFLEDHIVSFGKKHRFMVRFIYKGDPEIAASLSRDDLPFDAIWPLHRIWLDCGDNRGRVTGDTSIMYSPVVAGVDENLVVERRLSGENLLSRSGGELKLPPLVQSGSGAVGAICMYNLRQKTSPEEMLPYTWLTGKETRGPAMLFTTEAEILRINRALAIKNKPGRLILYLDNMLPIADSPLGLLRKSKKTKGEFFVKLKNYLLSKDMQKFIIGKGRRSTIENHLKIDFRDLPGTPGLNRNRILTPCRFPARKEFLEIFNKLLRTNKKVSRCALLLDFSQSMKEGGRDSIMKSLVERLAVPLGPVKLYVPAADDRLIFIPFSHLVRDEFAAGGPGGSSFSSIVRKLSGIEPRGATSFYGAILHGLDKIKKAENNAENLSVVLVTDGANNTGISFKGFKDEYSEKYPGIPVHVVYFENTDRNEVQKITALTGGRLFDGTSQIDETLRIILGYQ